MKISLFAILIILTSGHSSFASSLSSEILGQWKLQDIICESSQDPKLRKSLAPTMGHAKVILDIQKQKQVETISVTKETIREGYSKLSQAEELESTVAINAQNISESEKRQQIAALKKSFSERLDLIVEMIPTCERQALFTYELVGTRLTQYFIKYNTDTCTAGMKQPSPTIQQNVKVKDGILFLTADRQTTFNEDTCQGVGDKVTTVYIKNPHAPVSSK